ANRSTNATAASATGSRFSLAGVNTRSGKLDFAFGGFVAATESAVACVSTPSAAADSATESLSGFSASCSAGSVATGELMTDRGVQEVRLEDQLAGARRRAPDTVAGVPVSDDPVADAQRATCSATQFVDHLPVPLT